MRNILIVLLLLTFLVGCQTTPGVKEEPKEAKMDNKKQTLLTVENFNLLKNYIIGNGICISSSGIPPIITIYNNQEKNLILKYMLESDTLSKVKISQMVIKGKFIPYTIYYENGRISWDYEGKQKREIPDDIFKEHFCMVIEYIKKETK